MVTVTDPEKEGYIPYPEQVPVPVKEPVRKPVGNPISVPSPA